MLKALSAYVSALFGAEVADIFGYSICVILYLYYNRKLLPH